MDSCCVRIVSIGHGFHLFFFRVSWSLRLKIKWVCENKVGKRILVDKNAFGIRVDCFGVRI